MKIKTFSTVLAELNFLPVRNGREGCRIYSPAYITITKVSLQQHKLNSIEVGWHNKIRRTVRELTKQSASFSVKTGDLAVDLPLWI